MHGGHLPLWKKWWPRLRTGADLLARSNTCWAGGLSPAPGVQRTRQRCTAPDIYGELRDDHGQSCSRKRHHRHARLETIGSDLLQENTQVLPYRSRPADWRVDATELRFTLPYVGSINWSAATVATIFSCLTQKGS